MNKNEGTFLYLNTKKCYILNYELRLENFYLQWQIFACQKISIKTVCSLK